MTAALEILAIVLGFICLFGTILATALPMWRVSAFIGANIIVMEELWEGLWMTCYNHEDFRMQCKEYDSLLILPTELRAARVLMCLSVVLIFFALIITGCGSQKCNCCRDNMKSKNIVLVLGGCLFLISFLTTLIPVSWVGHTVIRKFYNPTMMDSQKRELGGALFLGWAMSGIQLITGITVLFIYSKRRSEEDKSYPDAFLLEERDEKGEESVSLQRTSSSFYKHQVYV